MLAAQLIVCIGAVALAGWTLGVTGQLIRERDRLQERVIQLEETMAARGDIPPAPTAMVEPVAAQAGDAVYPGSISDAAPVANGASPVSATPARTAARQAPDTGEQRNLSAIVSSLFGPAPTLRTVVLHVRSQDDARPAAQIAQTLQQSGDVRVLIGVMPAGDPRQSGYSYFDGRQSRAAADLVAQFHETARSLQWAQWSAQLRGVALPAQGEYTADRLDILLPPLPAPAPPPPVVISTPPATTTP